MKAQAIFFTQLMKSGGMTRKGLLLLAVSLALMPAAFAATCPNGPYTAYLVPNFSCTLGNLTFNAFGYFPSANPIGLAIPASAVTITTINTPGDEGFRFGLSMSVATLGTGVSSFQDSLITFTVSAAQPAITGLQLSFDGSFTGTGLTGVAETYCFNHDLLGCPPASTHQIGATNPPQNLNSSSTFAAVKSISLSKDINATSGINGTAALSQATNTFSNTPAPPGPTAVPLPPSLLLTLTGMAGTGVYMARRKFARPN